MTNDKMATATSDASAESAMRRHLDMLGLKNTAGMKVTTNDFLEMIKLAELANVIVVSVDGVIIGGTFVNGEFKTCLDTEDIGHTAKAIIEALPEAELVHANMPKAGIVTD